MLWISSFANQGLLHHNPCFTHSLSAGLQMEQREVVLPGEQKAYEQIRAERNSYSRDLIAAQAEVADAKRKFARVVTPPLPLSACNGCTAGRARSSLRWDSRLRHKAV